MQPTFKPADLTDLDCLLDFMEQFYRVEQVPFDSLIAKTTLTQLLIDHTLGRVWLIQLDNTPIGYVALTFGYSLEFQGRDAFIDELFIRECDRGCGIGRQTIEFIQAVCPMLGIKALHLEVGQDNHGARSLYEKTGFVASKRALMTQWITPEAH